MRNNPQAEKMHRRAQKAEGKIKRALEMLEICEHFYCRNEYSLVLQGSLHPNTIRQVRKELLK